MPKYNPSQRWREAIATALADMAGIKPEDCDHDESAAACSKCCTIGPGGCNDCIAIRWEAVKLDLEAMLET